MAASQSAVIVGIDGSRAALGAALWAIPEALSRDIPLRLVCAIDPRAARRDDPDDTARRRTAAEAAIRFASTMVQSTDPPVKVDFEIAYGRPISVLLVASAAAPMLCVGTVGFKRFGHGHLGSTAAALLNAGVGPLALVRAYDDAAHRRGPGAVVVEVDSLPRCGALLKTAMDEARRRQAPVRAVMCWQSCPSDHHDGVDAVANDQYRERAEVFRQLAQWKRRYSDLRIHAVTTHAGMADYLTGAAARSVQLVVVRGCGPGVFARGLGGQTVGPALTNTNCSLLIADH